MMPLAGRMRITLAVAILTVTAMSGSACAQPNPYRAVDNWAKLPEGRTWGATSAVGVDRVGNVWVFERCGGSTCAGSSLAPILKFDPSGKLLKTFGAGMFVFPHGIYVDKDDNVWVVDGQGKDGKGQQVVKFSPEGRVMLTLGKAGVAGDGPDTFNQPSAVVVASNGDIFVADGHGGDSQRAYREVLEGRQASSKRGGRKDRLPVSSTCPMPSPWIPRDGCSSATAITDASRFSTRTENSWKSGSNLACRAAFSSTRRDNIYVADNHSDEKSNPGFKQGIRVGSAKDGSVKAFIPALGPETKPTTVTEGVAADTVGNLYGAETGTMNVRKYVKK